MHAQTSNFQRVSRCAHALQNTFPVVMGRINPASEYGFSRYAEIFDIPHLKMGIHYTDRTLRNYSRNQYQFVKIATMINSLACEDTRNRLNLPRNLSMQFAGKVRIALEQTSIPFDKYDMKKHVYSQLDHEGLLAPFDSSAGTALRFTGYTYAFAHKISELAGLFVLAENTQPFHIISHASELIKTVSSALNIYLVEKVDNSEIYKNFQ